jgi:hypothetical protein
MDQVEAETGAVLAIGETHLMQTHVVERTSPKGAGQMFIGTCRLCGETGLPASAALLECKNPRAITSEAALIGAVLGE